MTLWRRGPAVCCSAVSPVCQNLALGSILCVLLIPCCCVWVTFPFSAVVCTASFPVVAGSYSLWCGTQAGLLWGVCPPGNLGVGWWCWQDICWAPRPYARSLEALWFQGAVHWAIVGHDTGHSTWQWLGMAGLDASPWLGSCGCWILGSD